MVEIGTHKPDNGPPALIPLLVQACHAFLEQENWTAAHETADHATTLARSSGDDASLPTALFLLGRALSKLERREDAATTWEECLSLQEDSGDLAGAALTACELGIDHRTAGHTSEALVQLKRSLRFSSGLTPGPIRGRALEQLGIVERAAGRAREAAVHFEGALRIYETLPADSMTGGVAGDTLVAGAHEKLGNTYQDLGEIDTAQKHYRAGLEVYERTRDLPRLAALHNNLAGTLHKAGNIDAAIEHFEEARDLFRELGPKRKLAIALGNLGVIKTWMGEAEEAESLLHEGLSILQEEGDRASQPTAMHNLSLVCFFGGRYEEAIRWTDEAIEARKELGQEQRLTKPWLNRAYALLELGRVSEAEACRVRIERTVEGNPNSETLAELAILDTVIAIRRHRLEKAIESGRHALEIARSGSHLRTEAAACLRLGEAYLVQGDPESAREWLTECESRYQRLQFPYHAALCSLHLGRLFLAADSYEAAAHKLRHAADVFHRLNNHGLEVRTLMDLARSEWHLSRAQAEKTLEKVKALASSLPREDFEAQIRRLSEELRAAGSVVPETAPQLVQFLRDIEVRRRAMEAISVPSDAPDGETVLLEALVDCLSLVAVQILHPDGTHSTVPPDRVDLFQNCEAFLNEVRHATSSVRAVESSSTPFEGEEYRVGIVLNEIRESDDPDNSDARSLLLARIAGGRDVAGFLLSTLEVVGLTLGRSVPRPGEQQVNLAPDAEPRTAAAPTLDPGATAGRSHPAASRVPEFRGMIGTSVSMRSLETLIRKIAPSTASVLIQGESGTGKELVARALHDLSGRPGPLVVINCPSFPRELIESELFGYEKGAFTGATGQRPGQVERANGGTLFLDEIGDLEMAAQTKLLRFLEQREFLRVGGRDPIRIDVRLIAATSRDLESELQAGRFREDLYHRIRVVPIHVPPLRDRSEDIDVLVRHFLQDFDSRQRLAPEALHLLRSLSWKGNVRELKNLVQRLVATLSCEIIAAKDIPEEFHPARTGADTDRTEPATLGPRGNGEDSLHPGETLTARLMNVEGALIRQELERCDWNQSKAARRLGITEYTIRDRMKRYQIHRPEETRRAGRRRASMQKRTQ